MRANKLIYKMAVGNLFWITLLATGSLKAQQTFRVNRSREYQDWRSKVTNTFYMELEMTDSTVNRLKATLKSTPKKQYYLESEKSGRIYPADTKSITCFHPYFFQMKGIPADSCWLFLGRAGVINCYTKLPDSGVENSVAIQKGGVEQPIVPLTKAYVREFTKDDEDTKLANLIERGKLIKAVLLYNKRKL